jgi:cadmium resistance protein CadD (predicted permease)
MTTSFIVYLGAFLIITAGIAFGMQAAGLAQEWIIAVVLVLIGIGVMTSLTKVREWEADQERQRNRRPPGRDADY